MAKFKMGEIVRVGDSHFIFWNSGISNGIDMAVVERSDDMIQRDQPRFQTFKVSELSKVTDPKEIRAARYGVRTATR